MFVDIINMDSNKLVKILALLFIISFIFNIYQIATIEPTVSRECIHFLHNDHKWELKSDKDQLRYYKLDILHARRACIANYKIIK